MDSNVSQHLNMIPSHWENYDYAKKPLHLVELVGKPEHKAELDKAVAHFHASAGVRLKTITSCRRVQNMPLWMQYWASRERVKNRSCNQGKTNDQIEQLWLFHGCRTTEALTDIITNGFDNQRANSMPYGVWFAQQASYSWGGYTIAHPDGTREIILARVVSGSEGDDDGSGRRAYIPIPGVKTAARKANMWGIGNPPAPNAELADCQSHMQGSVKVFVVYRADQLYPEYLLRGK